MNDRVTTRVVVLRGMRVFGRIAAANVATGEAKAERNPTVAGLQAFLTSIRSVRGDVVNLVEVGTLLAHILSRSRPVGRYRFLQHPTCRD